MVRQEENQKVAYNPNAVTTKPQIIVFAGPNGSGKSTITGSFENLPNYINADEIQKALGCGNLEAAIMAEQKREDCIEQRLDFSFETVLSTDRNLKLLQKAKDAGYFIKCFYIITADPIINVMRVAERVALGGHPVEEDKITQRFYKCLELIKDVIEVCDVVHIYDNSELQPFRIFKKKHTEYYYQESDFWDLKDVESLTNIKNILSKSLN